MSKVISIIVVYRSLILQYCKSCPSHNMIVAMEILLKEKNLEESKNKLQETVYELIASISSNIDYRDQDENVIDQKFDQMVVDGNLEASIKPAANTKGKRKRTNGSQRDASNTDSVNSVH